MTEKKMDGLCKAGCIVSIVSSGIIILWALIVGIGGLIALNSVNTSGLGPEGNKILQTGEKITAILLIFIALIQLLPLFFTINLLRGKANSNIPAGVLALIFSGIIGGILILVGKYTETPVTVNQQ